MKQFFAKSPFLVLVVVGCLAAGTVLVSGYADGPTQGAKVTADGKCADCAKAGTEACCKATGDCQEAKLCASTDGTGTCAAEPAGECCQEKTQTDACCGKCAGTAAKGSCAAGGCVSTE